MAATLNVTGKAAIPLEDDSPVPTTPTATIDLALSMAFGQRALIELNYDQATNNDEIDLGTLGDSGAKVLVVKSPIGGCTVKFNDSAVAVPVAPGTGYIMVANPQQGWLTGIKVTVAGPAKVRIYALG